MPTLTIDGTEIEVTSGSTVFQACEQLGIEIPHFCYHERLSIAGNCRMCLVEISPGPQKPQVSCATQVSDGMVVKTNTPMVREARRGVMELLLINHPLDCPICDQGGECDLQDQAIAYGRDRSRYLEEKRAVTDKYLGPLIETHMTRCIHCTRCVRFMNEVAGIPELGTLFRGESTEITTYIGQSLSSELSGNLVDICPVGALTNRSYAFKARPWELSKTESIDVLDALGSAIRVDSRGMQVMRILPRLNEVINEEWLSDKARYACDGLAVRRLDTPYVRRNGKLQQASWEEALTVVSNHLKDTRPDKIAAIAGDLADCETMIALKDLMGSLGVTNLDCRQDTLAVDRTVSAAYRFNSTISGVDIADVVLLVGSDPRREAVVLNSRIRKRWLTGELKIASIIRSPIDLTYPTEFLGSGPETLKLLAEGKHPFCAILTEAKYPMLILGQGSLMRRDSLTVLGLARVLAEETGMIREHWNGFNVLHTSAALVGGIMVGFLPDHEEFDKTAILNRARLGDIEFLYLLNADELDMNALGRAFIVYQGHHGDAGANRADVILPGAAYTEKNAFYVNTEGRVQSTRLAVHPPGEAREDWKIIFALSQEVGKQLPYNTLPEIRERLAQLDSAFSPFHIGKITPATWGAFGKIDVSLLEEEPFISSVDNFYMTDPISRASPSMAECAESYASRKKERVQEER